MHADKGAPRGGVRGGGTQGGAMPAAAGDGRLPSDQVDLAVEVFRMLADATRIQILWSLIEDELSVNELAERVGKAPASVSQHLAKLRMARLVRPRRAGTQVFYRLDNDHVARLITDAMQNAEHAGPGVPSHHRGAADGAGLDRLAGRRQARAADAANPLQPKGSQ